MFTVKNYSKISAQLPTQGPCRGRGHFLWKSNKFSKIHFQIRKVLSWDNSDRLQLADLAGKISKFMTVSFTIFWVSPLPSMRRERPPHFQKCSASPVTLIIHAFWNSNTIRLWNRGSMKVMHV